MLKNLYIYSLPKFMSIKVSEANLRAGPGTNFPIELIYVKKNLVIKIVMFLIISIKFGLI